MAVHEYYTSIRIYMYSFDIFFFKLTGQQLYLLIAEFIPKLKTRQTGSGGGAESKGAAGTGKKKKKKK